MDWNTPAQRPSVSINRLTHHSDGRRSEPTKAQLKRKADEEIRTLDPLLGKEMLYH